MYIFFRSCRTFFPLLGEEEDNIGMFTFTSSIIDFFYGDYRICFNIVHFASGRSFKEFDSQPVIIILSETKNWNPFRYYITKRCSVADEITYILPWADGPAAYLGGQRHQRLPVSGSHHDHAGTDGDDPPV